MIKGSYYLFTLPVGFHRGMSSVESMTEYVTVEDVIAAAINSVVNYVNNTSENVCFDQGHWHSCKDDLAINQLVNYAAIMKYEELFTGPDCNVSMRELEEAIGDRVFLAYNTIRNHLINPMIKLVGTQLVNDLPSHQMCINWLSASEFVVVLDAGNKDLAHNPMFINSEPQYV